jgi:uncharacterized membrane protein YgcG
MVLFSHVGLHAEYFTIEDYRIQINLYGKEAYFEVKERIKVRFSEPRHGIFRHIPVVYRISGDKIRIKLYDIEIEKHPFDKSREGSNLVLKIGSPDTYVEGDQEYVITYKVKKAFLFQDQHTEFYWNLVGTDWPVEIKNASFQVALDEAIPMTESDYHVFTGNEGSRGGDAEISYYLKTFEGKATRTLQPYEGMTLAIRLPLAYVSRPGPWEVFFDKYGMPLIGGFLLLIISGLFYRTWNKYGRDTPLVKMVSYLPPAGLTPSEAGIIIDERANNVDILSLLPYWAHLGYITIRRIPVSWGKDDHELTRLKPLGEDARAYEKIIFDALFAGGDTVKVNDLKNHFYQHLNDAKTSLKTHLDSMGVYYPISVNMQVYAFIASGLIACAAVISFFIFSSVVLSISLGIAAVIGFVFSSLMLKKNEKGNALYREVYGFKMFVKAAEKDKIERLLKEDSDYFEKTIPYAMIFGYAAQWGKKFDGLLTEPPKWYLTPPGYYGGAFMPSSFGSNLEDSVQDIQQVFSSVPSSSGSDGGFSGGSSGGGFGGGGGGSW